MKLDRILKYAINNNASDIHLTIDTKPVIRINNNLTRIGQEKLSKKKLNKFLDKIIDNNKSKKNELENKGQVDLEYQFEDYRFRVNAYYQRNNPTIALRLIPNEIPSLKELGVPQKVKDIITSQGLFIVTGPTGSGKTTTLASMIDLINENYDKNIITLENPIEYTHKNKKSIINQRSVGKDTESFTTGIKSTLRQDPDIIMIGEMRDLETISTAITLAETGHLVLATLHTKGATKSIDRIIDVFPPHQQNQIRTQLAMNLIGVLSQKLIPTINNREMVLASELLLMTSAVENLIREGKTHQITSIMQTNRKKGMFTIENSLAKLYADRKITKKQAINNAFHQDVLKNLIE